MDFTLPDEWVAAGDALIRFIQQEVEPLEKQHADLLHNERNLYTEDGRYAPAVMELRARIRRLSAEAGFYTALGDESLGGGGLGAQAAVYLQERLNAHVGPSRHLIQTVILPSPFTNGLTPVLKHMDPQVLGATCRPSPAARKPCASVSASRMPAPMCWPCVPARCAMAITG